MSGVDYVVANSDIESETKDLVLRQFYDSDNIQKLIEIIADEFESYEEMAESLFTAFLLENAEGVVLDYIGEFLNYPRDNRSDDDYRTAILIAAIGSSSSITRDSIQNLINIVTGGLGGYTYNGSFHDLYVYAQESCLDSSQIGTFLDKYLPINTQASIILESGAGFGFEGNPSALGFGTVDSVDNNTGAGGLASRISLTSLDILGYPDESGDNFEYELDSTYRDVLSLFKEENLLTRRMQTLDPYVEFSPPEWDSSLSALTYPVSYSLAIRSPSGEDVYLKHLSKVGRDEPLDVIYSLIEDPIFMGTVGDGKVYSDLNLPNETHYYEVQLPYLPLSPSMIDSMFGHSVTRIDVSVVSGITTTSASTLNVHIYTTYDDVSSNYTLTVKFTESIVTLIDNGSSIVTETSYTTECIPYQNTASDLTTLNGIVFGVLCDPSTLTYKLYVNGSAYDGDAGFVKITSLSGDVIPSSLNVGDIFNPSPTSMASAMFGIAGYTDNSAAEPSVPEYYGSTRWVYNRDDLIYTDQLPENTADIFGRTIN